MKIYGHPGIIGKNVHQRKVWSTQMKNPAHKHTNTKTLAPIIIRVVFGFFAAGGPDMGGGPAGTLPA